MGAGRIVRTEGAREEMVKVEYELFFAFVSKEKASCGLGILDSGEIVNF